MILNCNLPEPPKKPNNRFALEAPDKSEKLYSITVKNVHGEGTKVFFSMSGKPTVSLDAMDVFKNNPVWHFTPPYDKEAWGNKNGIRISDAEDISPIYSSLLSSLHNSELRYSIMPVTEDKDTPCGYLDFESVEFACCFCEAYNFLVDNRIKLNEYYVLQNLKNEIKHSVKFRELALSFVPEEKTGLVNLVSVDVLVPFNAVFREVRDILLGFIPDMLCGQKAKHVDILKRAGKSCVFESLDCAKEATDHYSMTITEYGRYMPDLIYADRVSEAKCKILLIDDALEALRSLSKNLECRCAGVV